MIIKKSFCLGGAPLVRLWRPADSCLTQQGVGIRGEGNKALIGKENDPQGGWEPGMMASFAYDLKLDGL